MDVVGHDNVGVETEASFGLVFFEDGDKELCVGFDAEEGASVRGDGGDEEGADFLRCDEHSREVYRGMG
ncbi:MAG TPA: hypothetical protein VME86_08060 [Acidobacteriaceae bacterium]|nr:hypothetical protein [Acidobacteriaceae bacterium]